MCVTVHKQGDMQPSSIGTGVCSSFYGLAGDEYCELGRLMRGDTRTPGMNDVCPMLVGGVRDGTKSVTSRRVCPNVADGGGECLCCGTEALTES